MTKPTTFAELLGGFMSIINTAIPVLITITVAYFIWKLVDAWILNGGDEARVEEGRRTAVIGVVVLVIMFSVWGIVAFLQKGILG